MARRVDLPASKLKARKRKQRIRIAAVVGVGVVVLVGFFAGLSYIPALQIKTVQVAGAQTLSTSTLQAFVTQRIEGSYWFIFPKRNIFLYPKQVIRDDLVAEYPVLSSADVRAHTFDTLLITLVEREPRVLWCGRSFDHPEPCQFVDDSGVVYGPAPTFSSPVYTQYYGALPDGPLPKRYLAQEHFTAFAALVDAIAQKLTNEQVAGVALDGTGDVRMHFESGFVLLFTLNDHPGDVFERLSLALTAEPVASRTLSDFAYLDLRFGDKLYYKLKSGVEGEE
jgi:cell division septal protein FtsQ